MKRLLPELAAADLRHEWILTLCLVIAVAAVVAPLLVLLGLKYGTIATLRQQLVENPAYREIRPAQTQEYRRAWLDRLEDDPAVQFLVPTISPAASVIQARGADGRYHNLDLLPTAPGDPLLLAHGVPVPGPGACVLTAPAARRLGVERGDRLTLRATRRRKGRGEYGPATLEVAGVLPEAAGTLARVYAPLELVEAVERFKQGFGVPERGWPGGEPVPFASYQAVLVLSPKPLPPLQRNALLIESGLADIEPLDAQALARWLPFSLPSGWEAWALTVPRGHVSHAAWRAVKQKLRGRGAVVLPAVARFELMLEGETVTTYGLSLSATDARRLSRPATPWGGVRRAPDSRSLLQVLAPAAHAGESRLQARFQGRLPLEFPLRVVGAAEGPYAVVPVELAGWLQTARRRPVRFEAGAFRMETGGYRGFRLYTHTIDQVPALARRLEAEGVPVVAEIEAITRIQVLDRGLTRLFWLIAVLGIGGGVAVLVASLYASVERKRRDLAMLRLIGFSRGDLFLFPVFEGLMIAGGGLLTALGSYAALAAVINRVFAEEMPASGRICQLPAGHVAAAAALTLGVAVASALLAAWKATHIDPADAIRDE